MEIPAYFLEKAARNFGEEGRQWADRLPEIISDCQAKWDLSRIISVGELSINLVCFAFSGIYGEVVLKLAGPHSERYTEMLALELFQGRLVCRCLDADRNLGAMLLERLEPGHVLWSVADRQRQIEIGSCIAGRLPLPIKNPSGFPTVNDWLRRAFDKTRRDHNPDADLLSLMEETNPLLQDTDHAKWHMVLLHGDLHHGNILSCGEGEWKAIDPQGVIGPTFFEPSRFIQNHVLGDPGLEDEFPGGREIDKVQLDLAVESFAERLGESRFRIAAGLFLNHILSTCWDLEMNYSRDKIANMVAQCSFFLDYARRLQGR